MAKAPLSTLVLASSALKKALDSDDDMVKARSMNEAMALSLLSIAESLNHRAKAGTAASSENESG